MSYQGDFVEDATVYIPFNTFDSNDPSASVTITDLVAGDVEVYKDGIVQTTAGAGVTVNLNVGANNGSHMIEVDTSNTTDAGFYVIGADYQVRINGTTVDAATINAWIGSFSIENRFMRGTDSAALASGVLLSDTDHTINSLTIDAAAGNAVTIVTRADDGNGVDITGHGLGAGVKVLGGAAGNGATVQGRSVGEAMLFTAGSTGHGIQVVGGAGPTGPFDGINIAAGTAGSDIRGDIAGTIDVCTTNTDMRGTDSANATVPDAAGTAAGLHSTTDGLINGQNDIAAVDVWNENISGIATANSAGTVVNDTLVDTGTTLPATLAQMQGEPFDSATDSLRAIRDRGDAAWTTGGAGSASQIADAVWTDSTRTLTANTNLAGLEVDVTKYHGAALTETSNGNLATNISTFYDNADAATAKVVDDVGGGSATVPPSIE